jgi:HK97 family phage major capsid protein
MPEKSRPNIRFYKELAEKNPAELEKVKQDFYRTLKLDHPLERVVKLTREAVDEEKREVTLSLSSEEPVERFFGIEVLGHDPTEIDSSRLEASAPWLWMHDWLDQRGVIASWEVKDKKLRVKVRLSRNPKGEELLRDMVDGITPNTSVGYMIEKVKEVTPKDAPRDAPRVFRVVRWMPYEGSSVTVPADITVGLGRSMNDQATPQERPMNEKQLKALQARRDAGEQLTAEESNALSIYEAGQASARTAEPTRTASPDPAAPATVDLAGARNKAVEAERERVAKINAIAEAFPNNDKVAELVRQGIKEGNDPSDVYLRALEALGKAKKVDAASRAANQTIGLSDKDIQRYSLRKAMQQAMEGKLDGLEAEAHTEALKRGAVASNGGMVVPFDVLGMRRDMTVGSFAAGGALVGSDLIGWVPLLRNKSVAFRAGVQMISGLKGDVYMGRQTGATTLYWVGEGVAPTESDAAFGQIQMTPKTGSALAQASRQLLMQSDPSIDALLTNDLLAVTALGMDSAIINGSGISGVPRGIINWSGIGSFGGGAATLAHMLNAEADIATANADDAVLRWLTTPGVREILKAKQRFSSTDTPLWTDDGRMIGYEGLVSNQLPASHLLFGDLTQDVVGVWGPGVELVVNPWRNSNTGLVDYQVWIQMDNALRQVGAITLNSNCTA